MAAAKEACADAGLEMEKRNPYRVGVIVGSGIGSLATVEKEYEKILEKGPARVNPLMVPLMISNMAAGNVSIHTGARENVQVLLQPVHLEPIRLEMRSGQSSMAMQM